MVLNNHLLCVLTKHTLYILVYLTRDLLGKQSCQLLKFTALKEGNCVPLHCHPTQLCSLDTLMYCLLKNKF